MSDTPEQNARILADFQMHKLDTRLQKITTLREKIGPRDKVTATRESVDLMYALTLELREAWLAAESRTSTLTQQLRAGATKTKRKPPAEPLRDWIVGAAQAWATRTGKPPVMREWVHVDSTGGRPSVDQVLAVFPTWNEMLNAAGFSSRTGGRSNVSKPIEEAAA